MGLLSEILARFRHTKGDSAAGPRPRTSQPSFPVNPDLPIERCIVDNRVFLLGLDQLYRVAMQRHERVELLACARTVAAALKIIPAQVPVEGYYTEDPLLTEYFRLIRALQNAEASRTAEVGTLPEFGGSYR